jgi:HEAT repeat protein
MKGSIAILTLMFAGVLSSAAQQNPQPKPDIDTLLMQLQSKDSGKRYYAFEQLKSDPVALQNAKVKAALLDLLDYETEQTSDGPRPGNSMYDFGEEGFGEYISELSETVALLVDWDDQHQACRMVKDGIGPPSSTPEEAARREKLVWPCVKQISLPAARWLDRDSASRIIIQLSAHAGKALDPLIAKEANEMIVQFLKDPYEGVRDDTVEELAKFGTEEMIPALKQVAESDPAMDNVDHSYWIRKRAAKAIAAIQKRLGRPQQ